MNTPLTPNTIKSYKYNDRVVLLDPTKLMERLIKEQPITGRVCGLGRFDKLEDGKPIIGGDPGPLDIALINIEYDDGTYDVNYWHDPTHFAIIHTESTHPTIPIKAIQYFLHGDGYDLTVDEIKSSLAYITEASPELPTLDADEIAEAIICTIIDTE